MAGQLGSMGVHPNVVQSGGATKPAVVEAMRDSDVVHLATHGEKEGLFFAGTSAAEATLSMAEVHALELRRTKLVVLSACDTFKGELRSDGVVGITRAFVAAGAPTLVASLWKVDDEATLELMRRVTAQHVQFFSDRGTKRCGSDYGIAMRTAHRFGDDAVNHAETFQILSGDLHRFCRVGRLFCGTPENRCAAFG